MLAETGMVHGRFQPFHYEHLDYVLRGLARSRTLIVGITNPQPSEFHEEPTSAHRHLPDSNPYSYFQRMEMISLSLHIIGVDLARVRIVPFPLFSNELWKFYLPNPKETTQFVRLFSDWEGKKVQLFEEYGFKVEILDRGAPKNIEATMVRKLMAEGGNWLELVPEGTQQVLTRIQNEFT